MNSSRSTPDAVRQRLDLLARSYPEWRSWLVLCEETLRRLAEPVWSAVEISPHPEDIPDKPLLSGKTVTIDQRRACDGLQRLLTLSMTSEAGQGAAPLTARLVKKLATNAVLEAALNQDNQAIAACAERIGIPALAVQALAQLAVMPLLYGCRRLLTARAPATWSRSYCPICGAWPVFLEVRGIDRARRARCGRCGEEWSSTWLRCLYCNEGDHRRLGLLFLEGKEEGHKVETCATCHGYVKTLMMLHGHAPAELLLADLATVELDLIALRQGFARPKAPACRLQIRLADRSSRLRTFFHLGRRLS